MTPPIPPASPRGRAMSRQNVLVGDCRVVLPTMDAESFQVCVSSPPYWKLRNYGTPGEIGSERTPEEYVASLVDVGQHVARVLRPDGTFWLNLGDVYVKKSLLGLPWRVALALAVDGWLIRQEIIWEKPNVMPSSAKDRPTTSHEHVFLLAKSGSYYYDREAIKEPLSPNSDVAYRAKLRAGKEYDAKDAYRKNFPRSFDLTGRNCRSVWEIATKPYPGAHNAPFPVELASRCILAGSKPGDAVLDPFSGAGTTGVAAQRLGRVATLIELNPKWAALSEGRVA